MALTVGSQAPDFTLKSGNGDEVTLSSFRGDKAVLVVFYPFAFSGVCTGELCSVRDDLSAFQNDDVQVLALSVDHPFALGAWAKEQGYTFPLLSDFWPHGATAQAYGVFNDALGCANRATFLIDREGVVVDAFETDSLGTPREQARYEAALAAL